MPIKDLSNRVQIPRLGKIHLGIKKKNASGVEYPVATDYFVLPKDHPQYQDLIKEFGEQPKVLKILIPTEDEDKWCSQYYRCYSRSRGLVCKGDGETASRMVGKGTDNLAWKDAKEVEMKDIECKGKDCDIYQKKQCNEIMNLQFMLPDIPGLGVWQIDTTSINSIININSASDLIKKIYGRAAMIPLLLTLEPREVNNPDDGKKKTVHILNLRVGEKLKDLAIIARQQAEQFLLPVSDIEAPDDGLRFMPDFDPVAPDTHTPQENIDQLWEGGKPAAAKPVEVIPAAKEKPAKTTKEQVDNAAPLTDEDFTPEPEVPPDPRTVEGSNSWFIVKMEELNILDKGVKEYLFNKMGVPIEDGPVSVTIAMLKDEQRAQLAGVFKRKESQLKKEKELAASKAT